MRRNQKRKTSSPSRDPRRGVRMSLAMLREAHGLTQIDVAAKLGIDQGAVSKREHAKRRVLVENLESYARALGCECEVVFNSRLGHRFIIDFDGDSILITGKDK